MAPLSNKQKVGSITTATTRQWETLDVARLPACHRSKRACAAKEAFKLRAAVHNRKRDQCCLANQLRSSHKGSAQSNHQPMHVMKHKIYSRQDRCCYKATPWGECKFRCTKPCTVRRMKPCTSNNAQDQGGQEPSFTLLLGSTAQGQHGQRHQLTYVTTHKRSREKIQTVLHCCHSLLHKHTPGTHVLQKAPESKSKALAAASMLPARQPHQQPMPAKYSTVHSCA